MTTDPRERMRQQLQDSVMVTSEPDGGPVLFTGLITVALLVVIGVLVWVRL